MTDKKVKFFDVTEEEVQRCMDDCFKNVETNHTYDEKGDFMDMLLEGAEIYQNFMEEQKEKEGAE